VFPTQPEKRSSLFGMHMQQRSKQA
jgi:hypothetical protein